jgi:hypothetical protein
MGELATVTYEGSEITLSMVKWGVMRRTALSWMPSDTARPCRFIPQYEIAIFDGPPKVVFSQQATLIFYYPDKQTAFEKWDELQAVLRERGLYGAVRFIGNGDPRKQGVLTNFPNVEEEIKKELGLTG